MYFDVGNARSALPSSNSNIWSLKERERIMKLDRRTFLQGAMLTAASSAWPAIGEDVPLVSVSVDTRQVTGALPHVWEECSGSDRAVITLREDWRRDLGRWHAEVGLKRVRFHGIFNDELGVYAPSIGMRTKGSPNFQNVDLVYDGLVARGAAPFVELSFMPKWLASADHKFGFYDGNTSTPASLDEWSAFIKTFVVHLVDRCGITAVRSWPFEVWNEPNLGPFWRGTQQQYFELYKATAIAIKSIDDALQVGGPSTAMTGWISELAAYCEENNAPIDFFSTLVYPGDPQDKLFGSDRYSQADVTAESMRRVREKIDATSFRGKPLWLSEWSSDSPAMIAHIISGCLPHCQAMSQWALSATFEEPGVADYILHEGYTGWGLMAQGIVKPAFNTYKLLHALGVERVAAEGPVLASHRKDRGIAAQVWNLAEVSQQAGLPGSNSERVVKGETKRFQVEFVGAHQGQKVHISFVDQQRGSPMPAWREMGSPQYITRDQIRILRARAEILPPTLMKLDASRRVAFDLPPEGVALVELL